MKPSLSELEEGQIYWQCDEKIKSIEAGSPITIWGNTDEITISDWSDPKEVRFMVLTLESFLTVFDTGCIVIKGYEKCVSSTFKRYCLTLTPYKP